MGRTRGRMALPYLTGDLMFAVEPDEGDGGNAEPNSSDSTDGERNSPKPASAEEDKPDDDEPLGEPGLKALKAERKRAAEEKRRADAAVARLKEIDDAEKTELERAQERIAELEKTTQMYETEKQRSELRAKVIDDKNVPSEWADLVTGDTEDEMNQAADKILANLSRADEGPVLRPTSGNPGGSIEAGREAAKSFRP